MECARGIEGSKKRGEKKKTAHVEDRNNDKGGPYDSADAPIDTSQTGDKRETTSSENEAEQIQTQETLNSPRPNILCERR